MRLARWTLPVVATLLIFAPPAVAQELEPRAFSPGPTGLNIAAVSLGRSSGDLVFDASIPIEDATANGGTLGAGYQRFFGLFGKTAKFAVATAYVDFTAKGPVQNQYHERHFVGFTDPRIAMSWIFLGAPAMAAPQYAKYRPKTLAGMSLSLSPPLGRYEKERLLNAGTNRWTLRSQLGISRYVGRWTLEAIAGGQFFTDNHQYIPGDSTQSQDPIYSFQAHAAYTLRPQMWVAASATYFRGGGSVVDDVPRPGFQSNSRYGVTASMPLPHAQSLNASFSRGLSTRAGSNYDTLIVSWATRWFDRKK